MLHFCHMVYHSPQLQYNLRARRRKKKKRKKIFNRWQKKRETYAQEEEEEWRHCASLKTWTFEGQFGNCQLTPNGYPKTPKDFWKMDLMRSIFGMCVQSTIIKRNFWPKVAFCTNQMQILGQLFAKHNFWAPKVETNGYLMD